MVDEIGDQRLLAGAGGMEAVEVIVAKGFEGYVVFSDDGLGFRENAMFESVARGSGFTLWGARPGGFERIEAIGLDLFVGCHVSLSWGGPPLTNVAGRGGVGSWEKLQVIETAGDGEMNVRVKVNRPNGWKAGSVVRNPLNYRNQWRWAEFYWDDRIAGSETEGCALYDSAL